MHEPAGVCEVGEYEPFSDSHAFPLLLSLLTGDGGSALPLLLACMPVELGATAGLLSLEAVGREGAKGDRAYLLACGNVCVCVSRLRLVCNNQHTVEACTHHAGCLQCSTLDVCSVPR
eukprot:scaffold213608_cov17-Tisochrysis_lutea.AAC.1